jgi:hypothetical protein
MKLFIPIMTLAFATMVSTTANALSLKQYATKSLIESSVKAQMPLAKTIVNQSCVAGVKELVEAGAIQSVENSDSISRQVNGAGLALAIIKLSDEESYRVIRHRIIQGQAEEISDILRYDEEFARECTAQNSVKDVVFSSIRYVR